MAVVFVAGMALAVLPSAVLELVAQQQWEVDLLRFSGVFIAGLGLLRPRTLRNASVAARRLPRWLLALWLTGGGYLLWGRPLFLVLAFALVVGATLESAVEQAHIASEGLRRRLDPPGDHAT
ncbi:MAG: hypothetical protein HKO70_06990 [Acidimicrobiia bacterium]|nr:hypothetical protein [Acidimicrobiia bacterium]